MNNYKSVSIISLVALSTFAVSPVRAQTEPQSVVTLAESKLTEAPNNQVQHFTDSINLLPGQESLI